MHIKHKELLPKYVKGSYKSIIKDRNLNFFKMGKRLKYFPKKVFWSPISLWKGTQHDSLLGKCTFKTTMKYYYITTRIKIKRLAIASRWGCGLTRILVYCFYVLFPDASDEGANWYNYFGKLAVFTKVEHKSTLQSCNSTHK